MGTKVPPDAAQRKARSEAALRAEGVPINDWLPAIESEAEARRRTTEETAYRAMALLLVAAKGEGLEQPIVEIIIRNYGLDVHLTPKERAFLDEESPSEYDRNESTWRYESAWVLLWALGYVEQLRKPTSTCDVPRAVEIMKERTPEQFLADARLRPLAEILDEADQIYRYHWAVVDADVNDRPSPAGLEPGVVFERHYALNWLIGYGDQEWDDVSTDT